MSRVLATDAAKDAANKMAALLSGDMVNDIHSLHAQGVILSTRDKWDGPAAVQFSHDWPGHETALNNASKAIETIRGHAAATIAAILTAGGGGGAPGTGAPSSGSPSVDSANSHPGNPAPADNPFPPYNAPNQVGP